MKQPTEYETVVEIKKAIMRSEKTYEGINLPTCQKTGTITQVNSHAAQLAQEFYNQNFK